MIDNLVIASFKEETLCFNALSLIDVLVKLELRR